MKLFFRVQLLEVKKLNSYNNRGREGVLQIDNESNKNKLLFRTHLLQLQKVQSKETWGWGGGFYRYLIILNYLHCCLEFNCWSCRMSIRTIPEDWSLVERRLTHLRWWVTTINGNLNIGVERYCLTFVIFPKTTISAYFDVIWQPVALYPWFIYYKKHQI